MTVHVALRSRRTAVFAAFLVVIGAFALLLVTEPTPARAATPLVRGDVFTGVGGGKAEEYTPSGTFVQTLNDTATSPATTGMCFDSSNNLYVTNFFVENNVSKFSPAGTLLAANWTTSTLKNPESCAVDQAGNVYVG